MPHPGDVSIAEALGPNAPTIAHENGAKESLSPFALDVVPKALIEVGRVLYEGEKKYGSDTNWRGISVNQHLRHALNHSIGHLAGDRSEGRVGHLARVACRALFAIEVELAAQAAEAGRFPAKVTASATGVVIAPPRITSPRGWF